MRQLSTLMTTDLEAMFDANRGDAEVLESLARELELRTRPKAVRLRADVARQIEALRGVEPERHAPAEGFGQSATARGVRLDWLEAPRKDGA